MRCEEGRRKGRQDIGMITLTDRSVYSKRITIPQDEDQNIGIFLPAPSSFA